MTEQQVLADALHSAAADLQRQAAPASPDLAGLIYRRGRRRRTRRRMWNGSLAVVAVLGIAAASVAMQDGARRDAGPAGPPGPTLQPAYAISYPASILNRSAPGRPDSESRVPGPPDGQIVQVVPPFQDLHLGVYVSADGQLCHGQVQGTGGGGKGCPTDLRPGWAGIYLESQEAPLSVSYGYVQSAAVGLYRQTGSDEPVPITLYRGPRGFEHLNFFIDGPGRAQGPETFLAYDSEGRLVAQRAAGYSQHRQPSGD